MTPDQLAKSGSEHGHQRAVFAYVAIAHLHGFEIADIWAETGGGMPVKGGIAEAASKPLPMLKWYHAIHNQGHGDAIRGGMAKAEGVRAGVADTFLPYPLWAPDSYAYAGLYIEMKKPSEKPKSDKAKGGLSDAQIEFKDYVESVGYVWRVCYSWREAVEVLKWYVKLGQRV